MHPYECDQYPLCVTGLCCWSFRELEWVSTRWVELQGFASIVSLREADPADTQVTSWSISGRRPISSSLQGYPASDGRQAGCDRSRSKVWPAMECLSMGQQVELTAWFTQVECIGCMYKARRCRARQEAFSLFSNVGTYRTSRDPARLDWVLGKIRMHAARRRPTWPRFLSPRVGLPACVT